VTYQQDNCGATLRLTFTRILMRVKMQSWILGS
jgi:hypothetical protein